MGDITRNLSRSEFACKCGCGLAEPHPLLCCATQRAVDLAGCTKILVRSGSRCPAHNEAVSKASKSSHLIERGGYSCAGDYSPLDLTPLSRLLDAALEIRDFINGGVGIYVNGSDSFLHLDTRIDGPARWGWVEGAEVNFGEALGALHRIEQRRNK